MFTHYGMTGSGIYTQGTWEGMFESRLRILCSFQRLKVWMPQGAICERVGSSSGVDSVFVDIDVDVDASIVVAVVVVAVVVGIVSAGFCCSSGGVCRGGGGSSDGWLMW